MVLPVVIAAAAGGGVAAATGAFFLIRRLLRGSGSDEPYAYPQAFTLEELPKYDKSRPLGQMEFIMMKLHEMDKGVLSVALVLEMKSDVTEAVVRQALGNLARLHPLLRTKVVVDNDVPKFKMMKDAQLDFMSLSSGVWEDVLNSEVDKKFDVETGPLWRAVFLPNAMTAEVAANPGSEGTYTVDNVLVLSFHRSVVDEGFIAELCAQFLRILNHEMGDERKLETQQHDQLLPALDVNFTQTDVPPEWYKAMAMRIQKITEKQIEKVGEINENQPKAKEITVEKKKVESLPQEVVHKKLDQDLTKKFFNKCAQHEVAISAALEVAAVLAFAHDEKKKDEVMPMQIEQSVFLKPMLPAIPLEYCGNYSVENVIDTAVPQSSSFMDSYWNLAMSVTEGLATTMQTAMPIVDAGVPQEGKGEKAPEDQMEAATPGADPEPNSPAPAEFKTLRVSTMGACAEGENTKDPSVRIKGLFGHVGLRVDGPDMAHCHTAVNEQLCWTLTFKRGKASKDEAEALIEKTVEYINKALTLNPTQKQDVHGVPPAAADQSV